VRLAGPEIHQVGALSAQFSRLGGHSHGRGYFDPANAIGKDFCWSCNCHNSSIFADFLRRTKCWRLTVDVTRSDLAANYVS
jgi:hypothetical protein